MDYDEMIRRIDSGEPLIDITICKWKDISNGTGYCSGKLNCALCNEYIADGCKNCPVFKFTDSKNCYNTPFRVWHKHYMEDHYENDSDTLTCTVCRKLANEEVLFLEKVKSRMNGGLLTRGLGDVEKVVKGVVKKLTS